MQQTLKPSEIADYCHVHQRTVSRWIAKGQLAGHKLPGRGNYRVQVKDFVSFLSKQGMPVPPDLAPLTAPVRVLVIDDEEAVSRAISRVLTRAGFETHHAKDGFEAGVKLLQLTPALITLDLSMPGMNGFEVLEFIRQHDTLKHTRILVISGLNEQRLNQAKAAGADRTLAKPFTNSELLAAASALLEERAVL